MFDPNDNDDLKDSKKDDATPPVAEPSEALTENTRAAFPLHFISNSSEDGMCGHPSAVVLLTADAFGVLPPIAKLSHEQAMYHFISGYTAKLAGTEVGVKEPSATTVTA